MQGFCSVLMCASINLRHLTLGLLVPCPGYLVERMQTSGCLACLTVMIFEEREECDFSLHPCTASFGNAPPPPKPSYEKHLEADMSSGTFEAINVHIRIFIPEPALAFVGPKARNSRLVLVGVSVTYFSASPGDPPFS